MIIVNIAQQNACDTFAPSLGILGMEKRVQNWFREVIEVCLGKSRLRQIKGNLNFKMAVLWRVLHIKAFHPLSSHICNGLAPFPFIRAPGSRQLPSQRKRYLP